MTPTSINLTHVAKDIERRIGTLTAVGRRAVFTFQELPGLESWRIPPIDQVWFPEAMRVFEFGVPLALVQNPPSFRSLRQRIATALADGKRPAKSDWAEVQTAALLSHFGAAIEFIPRGTERTPDMVASWNAEAIQIEVTAADQKHAHAELQRVLSDFAQQVQLSDFDWNLLASFADAGDRRATEAALDAVHALREGERAGEHGVWQVHAVPQSRGEAVVGGEGIEALSPTWWPTGGPKFFCNSSLAGCAVPRFIRIQSLIPEVSYMNPLRAKADRPQWQKNGPAVIAVDTSELPDALARAAQPIREEFKAWDHVSGVLLFDYRPFLGERKMWVASVHANPYATHPLPEGLRRLDCGRHFDVEFICYGGEATRGARSS